jgi:hypothetical protein
VLGEIVAPNGHVVATGSYDTPGGGYAVRICSLGAGMDPQQIQYSALIGTGPSGQPVLQGPVQPSPAGGVLGVTATLSQQKASGRGAIMTRAGLAWFTLHTVNGSASLRVYDPVRHAVRVVKGLHAVYASNTVRITGKGLKLVLTHNGANDRITFSSPRFKASGNVVRGGFQIVA